MIGFRPKSKKDKKYTTTTDSEGRVFFKDNEKAARKAKTHSKPGTPPTSKKYKNSAKDGRVAATVTGPKGKSAKVGTKASGKIIDDTNKRINKK
jgi:hypothetical protein